MLRDFSKYPQKNPEPMLSNMVAGGLIFREPKLEKPCTLRVEAPLTINVQQLSLLLLRLSTKCDEKN
jgi:hypothetical protein